MIDLDSLVANHQNEFKICTKCKGINLTTLLPKIMKLDPNAIIKQPTCVSYCGPGRDFPFIILNNKPVIGENENDLLAKISEILS